MNNCNEKLKSIVTAINEYHNCNDIYICMELRDYVEEELGQLEVDFMLDKIKLDSESLKYTEIIFDFVESLERKQTNES